MHGKSLPVRNFAGEKERLCLTKRFDIPRQNAWGCLPGHDWLLARHEAHGLIASAAIDSRGMFHI
jgi:hypothetical protein